MDYGSTLDLKLARFLREAWAKLVRIAGLLLIINLNYFLPTPGLEHRNCMRQPMIRIQIRCRIATQTDKNILKETTRDTLPQFRLRKTLGRPCAKLARCRFKLPQSSPQTGKLNLNRRVLERSPYVCKYKHI